MSHKKMVSLFLLISYAFIPTKSLSISLSEFFSVSNIAKIGTGIGTGLAAGLGFGYYFWKKNKPEKIVVEKEIIIDETKAFVKLKRKLDDTERDLGLALAARWISEKENTNLQQKLHEASQLHSKKDAELKEQIFQKKYQSEKAATIRTEAQKLAASLKEIKKDHQDLGKFAKDKRGESVEFLNSASKKIVKKLKEKSLEQKLLQQKNTELIEKLKKSEFEKNTDTQIRVNTEKEIDELKNQINSSQQERKQLLAQHSEEVSTIKAKIKEVNNALKKVREKKNILKELMYEYKKFDIHTLNTQISTKINAEKQLEIEKRKDLEQHIKILDEEITTLKEQVEYLQANLESLKSKNDQKKKEQCENESEKSKIKIQTLLRKIEGGKKVLEQYKEILQLPSSKDREEKLSNTINIIVEQQTQKIEEKTKKLHETTKSDALETDEYKQGSSKLFRRTVSEAALTKVKQQAEQYDQNVEKMKKEIEQSPQPSKRDIEPKQREQQIDNTVKFIRSFSEKKK